MKFNLVVLPGDGVGPEVINETIKVLNAIGKRYGHQFIIDSRLVGGAAIDAEGVAVSKATLKLCKKADAVLLGAVGGPKWDDPLAKVRPEDGLLELRKSLGLFANLRPVKVHPVLVDSTNLKPDVIRGVDFIFVRELTGGLYFGKPKKRWQTEGGRKAVDSMLYSEQEIDRIVRVGFELARRRQKKLISVDKANVLESSRLWRQVALEVANDYPDISLEHMLVDACSMRIIQNPKYLDVLVTENTFGDILTDEASMLAGSMGMLPSASIAGVPQAGVKIFGLYEPIHGSAPRRAGQNMANPIATILSAAMMLRYSFALEKEAEVVEKAVEDALNEGYRTYDIMSEGKTKLGTKEMGDIIAGKVGG
ncbi:MAG: 3-isopropylmalate dehydrogenase [Chloroflexi bacterium RBG_13_51_18]|nr:MAG: 3-isopropylmalate dehydrogenase [Chloroflexi bacterium RBG_13_51_18]